MPGIMLVLDMQVSLNSPITSHRHVTLIVEGRTLKCELNGLLKVTLIGNGK